MLWWRVANTFELFSYSNAVLLFKLLVGLDQLAKTVITGFTSSLFVSTSICIYGITFFFFFCCLLRFIFLNAK